MAKTLDEHRDQVRERIFASFARLLRTEGYDTLTLAHVAADAEVSRTAMYNYFPDKESLLVAYTAHYMGRYIERLLTELATASDPIDRLRRFIRMQVTEMAVNHAVPTSLAGVASDDCRRKLSAHSAPVWGTLRMALMDAAAHGYLPAGDVDEMLPLVIATVAGRRTTDLSPAALEDAVGATTQFVLRGLGARLDKSGKPIRLNRTARHGAESDQPPAGQGDDDRGTVTALR